MNQFRIQNDFSKLIFVTLSTLMGGAIGCRTVPPEQRRNTSISAEAPVEYPKIPLPDAAAAEVPAGYRVEIVASGLTYPSSVEFDDQGTMYVAEAGYVFGTESAPARVMRVDSFGRIEVAADQLNGPITDLLWFDGRLYISHRGKVSVLIGNEVRDIVTGLPSYGDFQNNQLTVGPDRKLYLGQGSASNSGVVGVDNFSYGWLGKHPQVHDISPRGIALRDTRFTSLNPLNFSRSNEKMMAYTGPFQAFGHAGATQTGDAVKANGTILRFNPDGSEVEVYAWGFRNPFGVWGLDGILYATDNGYDERGSRPIANAPDVIWQVKKGGWYGFPDYAGGVPVTDPRFKPEHGPAPEFLLQTQPRMVDQPLVRFPPHSGLTKIDFSRDSRFGFEGQMFVGEFGDLQPMTGKGHRPIGFEVVRVDPMTGETSWFLRARADSLGAPGLEYVTTRGPKRLVDVRFSREGDALYVADFGAMVVYPSAAPTPHAFPGTGVIWRISRDTRQLQFPIGISFIPGKGNEAVGGTANAVAREVGSGAGGPASNRTPSK
jgi:glucose/arabinose dehydrogenase